MGLTLGATGKLMTLNGKLFTDENGYDCCCGVVTTCDCGDMPTTLSGRVVWSGLACPPSNDPGICEITGTAYFTLTKITPIPEGLGAPCTPGSYYTATIDDPCSQDTMDVEFICCSELGTSAYYFRAGGGDWWLMKPPELTGYDWSPGDCDCAVGLPFGQFTAPFGFSSCCGTSGLYIWWGECTEPPIVCGDTGPSS